MKTFKDWLQEYALNKDIPSPAQKNKIRFDRKTEKGVKELEVKQK